jgi:hypothetical protein
MRTLTRELDLEEQRLEIWTRHGHVTTATTCS